MIKTFFYTFRYLHHLNVKKPKYYDPIDLNAEFIKVSQESEKKSESVDKVKVTSDVVWKQPTEKTQAKNSAQKTKATPIVDKQQETKNIITIDAPKNIKITAKDSQQNINISSTNTPKNIEISTTKTLQNIDISDVNIVTTQDDVTLNSNVCCTDDSEEMINYLAAEHNKLLEENHKLKEYVNDLKKC